MWERHRKVMSHNPVSERLGTRKQGLQQCASLKASGNLRNSASLKPRTVNLSYWSSVSVLRSRSLRCHAKYAEYGSRFSELVRYFLVVQVPRGARLF